jgi:8-oxo-dGTP pyrophosphatase MutT (NUDIX family)
MGETIPPMAIEINSDEVRTPPAPSATVMVLRDSPRGPEVLMMRRHGNSAVLGGAHVFPGGKLDPQDQAVPIALLDQAPQRLRAALGEPGLDDPMAAGLYLAALRETFEECGLLLADGADGEALRRAEARIRAGEPFAPTLAALGLPLRTARLVPWSRWITPRVASVTRSRFDTRFFLAEAPTGQEACHDNHEATETLWVLPADGLRQYWDGAIELAPPQILSLRHLAGFASVAALIAAARSRPPPLVEPEAFDLDGERVICYPGDPLHSVPKRAWPGPTRLTWRNRRFEPAGGLAELLPAG